MKTRSRAKVVPEVIVIESEKQSVDELKSDDSSCSDVQNSSSLCSVQSDSQPFMNLAPVNQRKKKKNLLGLRTFLSEQKTILTQPEQEFQRAPILNLLRPLPKKSEEQIASDSCPESEDIDIEPPQSDEESEEMREPQPRKKPRLMEQLQKQLNLPAEEYVISGAGKDLRQQRKRQNKKRDYLIEKKFKEYKVGKKKDNVSNQVFNAIEDFFG